MDSKTPLLAGLILIFSGAVIKYYTTSDLWPNAMIFAGVANKLWFIFLMLTTGRYRPGKELVFLILGLAVFLSGLWLRSVPCTSVIQPVALIILGIVMKTTFVVLFIVKTKKHSHV